MQRSGYYSDLLNISRWKSAKGRHSRVVFKGLCNVWSVFNSQDMEEK